MPNLLKNLYMTLLIRGAQVKMGARTHSAQWIIIIYKNYWETDIALPLI